MDGEGEKNKSLLATNREITLNKLRDFVVKVENKYPDESEEIKMYIAISRWKEWLDNWMDIGVQPINLNQVRKYDPNTHTYIRPVT